MFFDRDDNIDNWAKENHPNAPSKKPVFIGGGTNSIADIAEKIKEEQPLNHKIYNQNGEAEQVKGQGLIY